MTTYAYNQLVNGINRARHRVRKDAWPAMDDCDEQMGIDKVVQELADVFADEDPKFDIAGFLNATGTTPTGSK